MSTKAIIKKDTNINLTEFYSMKAGNEYCVQNVCNHTINYSIVDELNGNAQDFILQPFAKIDNFFAKDGVNLFVYAEKGGMVAVGDYCDKNSPPTIFNYLTYDSNLLTYNDNNFLTYKGA